MTPELSFCIFKCSENAVFRPDLQLRRKQEKVFSYITIRQFDTEIRTFEIDFHLTFFPISRRPFADFSRQKTTSGTRTLHVLHETPQVWRDNPTGFA